MITPVDVKLAEALGFTRGSLEHTAKATLIAQFREAVIARELAAILRKPVSDIQKGVLALHKPVNAQRDADVDTWSRYAAAACDDSVVKAAIIADRMLIEQKKRFPSTP